MRNLFLAGMHRYLRRPLTYIFFSLSLLCGVIYTISSVSTSFYDTSQVTFRPDDYFWIISILLNMILIALNTGMEFSAGTIRNKITAGYTKPQIYFSETIISILFSIFMFVLTGFPFAAYHFSYLKKMSNPVLGWSTLFAAFLFVALLTVFICFVSANRIFSVIVSFLLLLGLYYMSFSLDQKLSSPEYYTTVRYENGETTIFLGGVDDMADLEGAVETTQEANPNYISGTKRTMLSAFNDCNPYLSTEEFTLYCYYTNDFFDGDRVDFENQHYPKMKRELISNCIMCILFSLGGALIFKKKNLK